LPVVVDIDKDAARVLADELDAMAVIIDVSDPEGGRSCGRSWNSAPFRWTASYLAE